MLRDSCIYGTAKLAAEILCKILSFNNEMFFNTAIIANAYGPGDYSLMIQNVLIDALYIIGEKGINKRTYYVGHRNLKSFKELINEVRDIISSDRVLRFGELENRAFIDYSLIDIDALYNDTGFEASINF